MQKWIEKIASLKVSAISCVLIAAAAGVAGSVYAYAQGSLPTFPEGSIVVGDDVYKDIDGVVHEYDDGLWDPEYDKKIEDGKVYEYDDEVWEEEISKDVSTADKQIAREDAKKSPSDTTAKDTRTSNNANSSNPKATWIEERDKKVEGGRLYEYDDGVWELERDKKVEDGQIYEYDDGVWELERDKKVEGNSVYENEYDDDWDDD